MPRYRGEKVRYRRRGVVRLRLRELLETRPVSPYGLAKFTGLSLNTIYRLTRPSGRFRLIRADTIERLCERAVRVRKAVLAGRVLHDTVRPEVVIAQRDDGGALPP